MRFTLIMFKSMEEIVSTLIESSNTEDILSNKKVLAIVPAYNEEDNIASTVEDLLNNAPGVDYVIINDGSKDKTLEICQERGYNVVSLPVNLGLAGAFQTGMRYALEHDYDYAIQFDADGQHSATYILPMVELAEKDDLDIVSGTRFKTKKKPKTNPRMIGSILITRMILYTTRAAISDPTSGMRVFGKRVIPLFANEVDFSPEPDTIAHLIRSGAKIGEVQVDMRERAAGESYLNLSRSVSYMLRVCISILFVQWFRKRVDIC